MKNYKLALQQLLRMCKQTSHVFKQDQRTLNEPGTNALSCQKENAVVENY